ncbi:MAG: hypothetical protein QW580_02080 [Nitrososphaerota archaeon]
MEGEEGGVKSWAVKIDDGKIYLVEAETPEKAIHALFRRMANEGYRPQQVSLLGFIQEAPSLSKKLHCFITLPYLYRYGLLSYEECEYIIEKVGERLRIGVEERKKLLEQVRWAGEQGMKRG